MQEVQTQTETNGERNSKCCGKKDGHRSEKRGRCGSRKHGADTKALSSALEILQIRFASGEIDAVEFEERRRLIASA
jgi:hypothetical protein